MSQASPLFHACPVLSYVVLRDIGLRRRCVLSHKPWKPLDHQPRCYRQPGRGMVCPAYAVRRSHVTNTWHTRQRSAKSWESWTSELETALPCQMLQYCGIAIGFAKGGQKVLQWRTLEESQTILERERVSSIFICMCPNSALFKDLHATRFGHCYMGNSHISCPEASDLLRCLCSAMSNDRSQLHPTLVYVTQGGNRDRLAVFSLGGARDHLVLVMHRQEIRFGKRSELDNMLRFSCSVFSSVPILELLIFYRRISPVDVRYQNADRDITMPGPASPPNFSGIIIAAV
jgi:hypothetical protein